MVTEKVSRYLVVSDNEYVDESGIYVRLLYGTRLAKLIVAEARAAEALRAGRLDLVPAETLAASRKVRIVVPADQDELPTVLGRHRTAARDVSSVHIALLPTSYCNMGCAYCGQEHTPSGLTKDHRDQVRARVLRAMSLPSTTAARIDWFGSEPMLGYAIIRDLARDFTRVADERGLRYSSVIATSGTLLTARNMDVLIRQVRITNFEITVDAPPGIHDVHRPLKSGRGSFWKIVQTVREAVGEPDYSSVQFQFRTNVDVHNQESIPRYLELMAELGFARPNVSFSIQPVHSWGNDVSQIEIGKRDFAERELGWLDLIAEYGLGTVLLPTAPKMVVCPLFDDWNDEVEQVKSWCTGCVFLPTCGGSGPEAWHEGHPPCPSYKLNAQGRLDLIARNCGLSVVATAEAPVAEGASDLMS